MPSGQKIKHFFLPLRQVCRVAPSLYSTLLHRQGSASAERHARVLAKDGESRTLACSPAAAAPERSPARPWSKRPGIADRAKLAIYASSNKISLACQLAVCYIKNENARRILGRW